MSRRRDWTEGEPVLLVHVCDRCGNRWYLPRSRCVLCGSEQVVQTVSAGRGLCVGATRLHVRARPGDGPPDHFVLVELDEGPVLMARAHDVDLHPGDRAVVEFRRDGHDDVLVPSFAQEGPRQ